MPVRPTKAHPVSYLTFDDHGTATEFPGLEAFLGTRHQGRRESLKRQANHQKHCGASASRERGHVFAVSARWGMTDMILAILEAALADEASILKMIPYLKIRHMLVAQYLMPSEQLPGA
jgi:hypothetical protein